jgi:hypothetical protein
VADFLPDNVELVHHSEMVFHKHSYGSVSLSKHSFPNRFRLLRTDRRLNTLVEKRHDTHRTDW